MTSTESCRSFGTLQLASTAKCTNGGSTIRPTRLGYLEAPFVETSTSRYSAHRVTRRNTSTSTKHAVACSATSDSSSRPLSKSTGTKRGSSPFHRYRFAASSAGDCDAANTHYANKSRTLGVLLKRRRKIQPGCLRWHEQSWNTTRELVPVIWKTHWRQRAGTAYVA